MMWTVMVFNMYKLYILNKSHKFFMMKLISINFTKIYHIDQFVHCIKNHGKESFHLVRCFIRIFAQKLNTRSHWSDICSFYFISKWYRHRSLTCIHLDIIILQLRFVHPDISSYNGPFPARFWPFAYQQSSGNTYRKKKTQLIQQCKHNSAMLAYFVFIWLLVSQSCHMRLSVRIVPLLGIIFNSLFESIKYLFLTL